MRGKSQIRSRVFTQAQLQRQFAKQREEEKQTILASKLKKALGRFRPKKSQRGKIIFITTDGKAHQRTGRVGFAVYVDSNGKKQPVRSYSRKARRLEKIPAAKKLSSIDISRVRSIKAKREFLRTKLNAVSAGALERTRKTGRIKKGKEIHLPEDGTRFAGALKTKAVDKTSAAVNKIAKELTSAFAKTKSNRDFQVTIGIHVKRGSERFWFETSRRIIRRDSQKLILSEARAFLGLEIYAFLAQQLRDNGLVMSGSATHVERLPENKGKKVKDWTNHGKSWFGIGAQIVTVENVEWRFDHIAFGK